MVAEQTLERDSFLYIEVGEAVCLGHRQTAALQAKVLGRNRVFNKQTFLQTFVRLFKA